MSGEIKRCGYLDIETTGLSPVHGELTVIGLYLDDGENQRFVQFVGDDISAERLHAAMEGVEVLYTYNGRRFDLPYVKAKLGVDLTKYCPHHDLMYDCWRRKLYGGLKRVERELGIERPLDGIDGTMAVELWRRYRLYGNRDALITLMEYNREDVLNLRALREKLEGRELPRRGLLVFFRGHLLTLKQALAKRLERRVALRNPK